MFHIFSYPYAVHDIFLVGKSLCKNFVKMRKQDMDRKQFLLNT